ncbi:MAG: hypothetical protein M1299_09570 [Firmicutes bacterium]|nr:hypothetical protein [Bacillota bacterium]
MIILPSGGVKSKPLRLARTEVLMVYGDAASRRRCRPRVRKMSEFLKAVVSAVPRDKLTDKWGEPVDKKEEG